MRPGYRKVSSDSEGLREYAEWTDPETAGGGAEQERGRGRAGEGEGQSRRGGGAE